MDKAHGYADKTLEDIEKELKEVYGNAQKQLAAKANAYMNRFIAEDEKQRKLLESGKLSKEDYTKWLRRKVMSGQRFTKMKEQCAEQISHVNQIALDHINNRLPDVYSVCYNALEKDVKGIKGYSFHIVSPDTVKTLAGRDKSLLPYKKLNPAVDIPWNMRAINTEVLQGVLQGESVKEITKRVFGYTTKTGQSEAEILRKTRIAAARTAQTLVTAAENKGRMDSYDRAAQDGVVIEKEWIATQDHATRDSHRDLDGTSVPENQPFDNGLMYPGDPSGPPEEVYNCFVADTKIATDCDVIRSYKHEYSGRLITVKTSRGVEFSCTPNHPILTTKGWVAAELLNNGDDLIVAKLSNSMMPRVNPDINHAFPSIDAIHKFFDKFGRKRTCRLGVNFHGDVPTTDVEIITQKRFLWDSVNACGGKGRDEIGFKNADKSLAFDGSLMKHIRGIWFTVSGNIRRQSICFTLFGRKFCHAIKHCLGTIPRRKIVPFKSQIDDTTGDVEFVRQSLNRLSSEVFIDDIVSVDVVSVNHVPVYNLQTENGYYFVNSIISQNGEKVNGIFAVAHNCRCSMAAVIKGFSKNDVEKREQREFNGAKSIEDAEAYAERFVTQYKSSNTGKLSSGVINYKGVELEYANEMNRAMTDVFDAYQPEQPLKNIKPMNKQENRFKDNQAEAAYEWFTNNFYYNKDYIKSKKANQEHRKQHDELLTTVTSGADLLLESASGVKQQYLLGIKESGRAVVYGVDTYGATIHEMGHYLDDVVFKKFYMAKKEVTYPSGFTGTKTESIIDFKQSMEKYATKISAYATTSTKEYVAESFAAYWKGEKDIVDPALVKVFEEAKKK